MTDQKKNFILYERQGWSERKVIESDDIEDMTEKMAEKAGIEL